jgi:hypothetical protein
MPKTKDENTIYYGVVLCLKSSLLGSKKSWGRKTSGWHCCMCGHCMSIEEKKGKACGAADMGGGPHGVGSSALGARSLNQFCGMAW